MAAKTIPSAFLQKIKDRFGYESLNKFQEDVVLEAIRRSDIFLSVKTGSGKSLCFQCLPDLWETVPESKTADSDSDRLTVLVVTPLLSITQEQVDFLQNVGLKVVSLKDSDSSLTDLRCVDFVFCSPEDILAEEWGRRFVKKNRKRLGYVVVDEAHTTISW